MLRLFHYTTYLGSAGYNDSFVNFVQRKHEKIQRWIICEAIYPTLFWSFYRYISIFTPFQV